MANAIKKILLIGETWMSSATHYKGFDQFGSVTFHSGDGEIAPGVYGRVDFGNATPPPVLYARTMVIAPMPGPPVGPVYLHVPPGHAKNWGKHCQRYNACGQPVYFVKSAEYERGYKAKGKKEK